MAAILSIITGFVSKNHKMAGQKVKKSSHFEGAAGTCGAKPPPREREESVLSLVR
jgi:hypothetical protein